MKRMKKMLGILLCAAMLLSLAAVGASALSPDVTADTWASVELQPLYVQTTSGEVYSELNEDYFELQWEEEIPEQDGAWLQPGTVCLRGFAISPDGRYIYFGNVNGGTGVRGVTVFDTETALFKDLYYHYDGEFGDVSVPFSYAKGVGVDDRGYVYVGFAFSKNYNVLHLGIAQQQEDGTLQEVASEVVFEFGDPGDEGGIHVGVNGVDVAKVGDKYYCYFMSNYDHDALYCYDVTDPANPKLNKDFGEGGCIIFSEPSNTVAGSGFTLKEGQYMDVDDDGVIWLVVNSNEGGDGIMKLAPDGSACAEVVPLNGIYSVEHEGGFLLCGMKDGSSVVVLDDASYETLATIEVPADYGTRVTRMQVINDVLFVCDSNDDASGLNAVHAAPLSPAGQEFFERLVANLSQSSGDETEEPTEENTADETEAPTDEVTETPTEEVTTEATTNAPDVGTEAPTDEPESGCGSTVGFAAMALLTAAAAFVACKKD